MAFDFTSPTYLYFFGALGIYILNLFLAARFVHESMHIFVCSVKNMCSVNNVTKLIQPLQRK